MVEYTDEDISDFVLGYADEAMVKKVSDMLDDMNEESTKIFHESEEGWADEYIVSKECPVKSHLCACLGLGAEGSNCSFYNGYKEKCVYPRTCTHNTASEHFLNLYDGFTGNVERYWKVPDEQRADSQITAKCIELGLEDESWAYAEFDDDGEKVTLVELATDAEIAQLWAQKEKAAEEAAAKAKAELRAEIDVLLEKYSGDTRADMERLLELQRKL